jgi:hypothetical protein
MLIELPNGKGRGQWQRILIDEFSDHPRWTAIIRCPDCGDILPIVNHAISSDGWVTPSVGHPVRVSCTWHVAPKLLGWAPCPPPPAPRETYECAKCGVKGRQLAGWGVASGGLLCPECIKP